MAERASPTQLRKALEIANLFTKVGLGFVPVPVANAAEFEKLAEKSLEALSQLVLHAAQAEEAASRAASEKGEQHG